MLIHWEYDKLHHAAMECEQYDRSLRKYSGELERVMIQLSQMDSDGIRELQKRINLVKEDLQEDIRHIQKIRICLLQAEKVYQRGETRIMDSLDRISPGISVNPGMIDLSETEKLLKNNGVIFKDA